MNTIFSYECILRPFKDQTKYKSLHMHVHPVLQQLNCLMLGIIQHTQPPDESQDRCFSRTVQSSNCHSLTLFVRVCHCTESFADRRCTDSFLVRTCLPAGTVSAGPVHFQHTYTLAHTIHSGARIWRALFARIIERSDCANPLAKHKTNRCLARYGWQPCVCVCASARDVRAA